MVELDKKKGTQKPLLRSFTKRTKSRKISGLSNKTKITLVLVFTYFALLLLLLPEFLFSPFPADLNSMVTKDIVAPFSLSLVNKEATEFARAPIQKTAPVIFVQDIQGTQHVLRELFSIYSTAQQFRQKTNVSLPTQIDELKQRIGFPISDKAATALLQYSQYWQLRPVTEKIVAETMAPMTVTNDELELTQSYSELLVYANGTTRPILRNDISSFTETKRKATRRLYQLLPNTEDQPLRNAIGELFNHLLYPTLQFDKEKTDRKLAELQAQIPPVKITVNRGQTILHAEELIKPEQKMILDEFNRVRVRAGVGIMFGRAILLFLLTYFTVIYLRTYYPRIIHDFNTITPACLLWVVTVVLAKAVIWLGGSAYLMPVGAFAMLAGIMFEVRFTLLMVTSVAVLLGVMVGLEVKHVLVFLLSGTIAALTVSHLKKRTDLIKAGLRISAVNFIGIIVLFLFDQSMFSPAIWRTAELFKDSLSGLANGIICYILTISFLPGFERLFNLTTDWKLLEYSDTKSELLTRLEEEAPGTYHHSLQVSSLADSAASAIGANALLCRISAYYHDIGKLVKPEYFSENQMTDGEKKKHDKLSPSMSALIIKNHVKHGLELAKENRLPPPVIDVIEQHHGTSLITYFYQEALELNGKAENGEPFDESHFRYPGPKPQTVESAIILLSDAVEAATASLVNPDEGDIHSMVRKIVNDRFADEQLEECELTLHDLHLITESLVRSLLSRYHRRIEYPEQELVESTAE